MTHIVEGKAELKEGRTTGSLADLLLCSRVRFDQCVRLCISLTVGLRGRERPGFHHAVVIGLDLDSGCFEAIEGVLLNYSRCRIRHCQIVATEDRGNLSCWSRFIGKAL